jgi:hypothetical protein
MREEKDQSKTESVVAVGSKELLAMEQLYAKLKHREHEQRVKAVEAVNRAETYQDASIEVDFTMDKIKKMLTSS